MSEILREIVDPKLLAQMGGLAVRARRLAEGVLSGMHRSPRHGASVEFSQHREYAPGDDVRFIDWKAFAKSDKCHVKQFEDETNLRAYLLVDTSGSMDYGRRGGPTKVDYAAGLAAALTYLLLKQGDAVGLLTFGEQLGAYIPPRGRPDHFWNVVRILERAPVGGPTNVVRALEHIAEVAHARSVVALFSDCFDFDGRLVSMLRQLGQRHDVIVFQVLDPDELAFPFDALTLFEDLESDARVLADPRGMKAQYHREIEAFCGDLRRRLREGGVDYRQVETAQPMERVLLDLMAGAGR